MSLKVEIALQTLPNPKIFNYSCGNTVFSLLTAIKSAQIESNAFLTEAINNQSGEQGQDAIDEDCGIDDDEDDAQHLNEKSAPSRKKRKRKK